MRARQTYRMTTLKKTANTRTNHCPFAALSRTPRQKLVSVPFCSRTPLVTPNTVVLIAKWPYVRHVNDNRQRSGKTQEQPQQQRHFWQLRYRLSSGHTRDAIDHSGRMMSKNARNIGTVHHCAGRHTLSRPRSCPLLATASATPQELPYPSPVVPTTPAMTSTARPSVHCSGRAPGGNGPSLAVWCSGRQNTSAETKTITTYHQPTRSSRLR